MTARVSGQLEDRDRDVILNALRYGPMANEHLLAYSQWYRRPFAQEGKICRRTQVLRHLGLIATRRYCTSALRGRAYHTLTARGFRQRFGRDPDTSMRKLFRKVSANDQ